MDKLVNYSSSSEEEDKELEAEPPAKKRALLLPMPFEKTKKNGRFDNKELYGGKKRQIEHVEGNWPSHIFINVNDEILTKLKTLTDQIEYTFKDIKAVESPHVSLSKLFILKYHWIDNFFKVLSSSVSFQTFFIELRKEICFLSNEDNSRHFVALLIDESCRDQLKSIVKEVDKSLKEFELPPYYEDSIFHMSILWKLSEFSDEEKLVIKEKIELLNNEYFYTTVDRITFKSGNKVKFLNSLS